LTQKLAGLPQICDILCQSCTVLRGLPVYYLASSIASTLGLIEASQQQGNSLLRFAKSAELNAARVMNECKYVQVRVLMMDDG